MALTDRRAMAYDEIAPEELRHRLAAGEDVYVLDVREADEVVEWPFPGAVHIPLGELGGRTAELPTDRRIVVVCHAGMRSAAAANALGRAGWTSANLTGGILAWLATAPTAES
jgi:rhodanese-related sulfurtransferase